MSMKILRQVLPWTVIALGAIYFLVVVYRAGSPPQPKSTEFNLVSFASLPVVDRGRVQPIDSVARVNLLILSNRQDFVEEKDGPKRRAIEWLVDTLVGQGHKYPIFRIENDQILNTMKLPFRTNFLRYSWDEIKEHEKWIFEEADRADHIPKKDRSAYDVKIMELATHIQIYRKLVAGMAPLVVPPIHGREDWLSIRAANDDSHPLADVWFGMLSAYLKEDVRQFNKSVKEYRGFLAEKMPDELSAVSFESFFNRLEPFNKCMHMYITVFALAVIGWIPFGWSKELRKAAFGLAVATLVLHTSALVMRMMIQGRPPVTNLYSSAVFIGWGCVVVGLVLEWIYKNGLGSVVAAVLGGLTLEVAHHLAQSGDTLEMMQAVLDTNFWLATHVTIVTFGYVATFVAGFIGILYILLGVGTPLLDAELKQALNKMIYGVICFATLLSFTGTVLGGIWADQSWGRFWGWDPKENGALMIVIWNALVLHARWGGLVKHRGVAVLAVGGNIITAWSWFGVNMLGVGLHSYGFIPGAVLWMFIFVASQLLVIAIGLMPEQLWWSNSAAKLAPVPAFKPPRL